MPSTKQLGAMAASLRFFARPEKATMLAAIKPTPPAPTIVHMSIDYLRPLLACRSRFSSRRRLASFSTASASWGICEAIS